MLLICPGTLRTGHACQRVLARLTPDGVEIHYRQRTYVVAGPLIRVTCDECHRTYHADDLTRCAAVLVA